MRAGRFRITRSADKIVQLMHQAARDATSSRSPALAQTLIAAVTDVADLAASLPPQMRAKEMQARSGPAHIHPYLPQMPSSRRRLHACKSARTQCAAILCMSCLATVIVTDLAPFEFHRGAQTDFRVLGYATVYGRASGYT